MGSNKTRDIIFNPLARLFIRVMQEGLGQRRCVDGGRALRENGGCRGNQFRFPLGASEQKVPGFVMGAQERLYVPAQRRVAGALFRHESVARGAGGQFNRPGEHDFGSGRRWVHRKLTGLNCSSRICRREPKADRRSRTIASAPFKTFPPKEAGKEALTAFTIYDIRFTSSSTIPVHRVNRIS